MCDYRGKSAKTDSSPTAEAVMVTNGGSTLCGFWILNHLLDGLLGFDESDESDDLTEPEPELCAPWTDQADQHCS
jgi:hypothetical protein